MKVASGLPFGGDKPMFPAGASYKAFAIGDASEYDQVTIDGHLLQAGRILWLESSKPVIKYVRGARSTAVSTTEVPWNLEVIGYEGCDQVVLPGPRPSRIYSKLTLDAALSQDVAGAAPNMLVIPFAGRRRAAVTVTPLSGTARVQYATYGRRWAVDTRISGLGAGGSYVYYELSGEGTAAAPLVTGNAGTKTAFDTVPPIGSGRVIGGTDSEESLDELVVIYAQHTADLANTADVYVEVEVSGEGGF